MKLYWIVLILSTILMANEPQERPKLPLEVSLPLLQSIEHLGMVMGEGPIKAYVFIDPNCPNSQNFVALIDENAKMRSKYTYYFFFYELKRFNSAELISKIYSAPDPIEAMKQYMIRHDKITYPPKSSVLVKMTHISKVAETLDVYKRPYIILVKRGH